MTTTFAETFRIEASSEAIARVLADRSTVLARLHAAGRDEPTIESIGQQDDRLRLTTTYRVSTAAMPSWMASRFTDGGPRNRRTERWTLAEQPTAEVSVESLDGGVRFEGTYALEPDGQHTKWVVHGTVRHPVPVIGRRVERFTADSLAAGYAQEAVALASAVHA
ncbi:DUF2505 domain-containing protein [Curtobacterium sp. ISL-83]|uniref:DUF2505 domain-containing protein n=1 Tax=Curtobacterium sp. ISL-83 TaxID=2819145 RepID=UPI001BE83D5F|nr:DUF2505 domain-containing protein [Curtobacterium sp. ISL-83]MBT2502191.1 DUF2505 domain-containing protein [Curtobacterium sp. ISL-83]